MMHFISGLPRSGSTLLAAILRQNPRFHAGMTSPVGSIYQAMLSAVSRRNESAVFISDEQRKRLLRGVFESYYRDTLEPVIFDTNRLWCAQMSAVAELFPDAKVICCVRHFSWILDSIERLGREHPFELSGLFGFETGLTVAHRCNRLGGDGIAGWALDALKEACYGPHRDRLLLIDYEALCKEPARSLRALYDFLGEPLFDHDLNHLDYDAPEFDLQLGAAGLHRVKPRVEWVERRSILPPEIFQRYARNSFWLDGIAGVRVITP